MCPLFPDKPCPHGHDSAESCMVRLNADFDPVADFRDYLLINCAVLRAEKENIKEKRE